jgi:predicted nucleotidyltransferase component of viral defense system
MARAFEANPQSVITRFAMERLLRRLSLSSHREEFVLKGALLFTLWEGDLLRSTSDLDLHGSGTRELPEIVDILDEVARGSSDVADGLTYSATRERAKYLYGSWIPGVRVPMSARLGTAHIRFDVDVGFGHAISPGAEERWYPSILAGFPAFRARAYPRETVIAEKIAVAVEFGTDNTRVRDYYDIWYLTKRYWFQGHEMTAAIASTFALRDAGALLARDDGYWEAAFSESYVTPARRRQWSDWLWDHAPHIEPPAIEDVIEDVERFAVPLLRAVKKGGASPGRWDPRE